MDMTTVIIVIIASIVGLMIGYETKNFVKSKKYPYLGDRFLRTLSYSEQHQQMKISDKLELRLENDFILTISVKAKNQQGEWMTVEEKSFYRPTQNTIQFNGPWHEEIANYLKNLYESKKNSEIEAEKKKQMEIQSIKENWNQM